MPRFPSPGTLEWVRKIEKAQKPKKVVKTIQQMKPPDSYLHPNCSHEAYIVCLCMAAEKYTELLGGKDGE